MPRVLHGRYSPVLAQLNRLQGTRSMLMKLARAERESKRTSNCWQRGQQALSLEPAWEDAANAARRNDWKRRRQKSGQSVCLKETWRDRGWQVDHTFTVTNCSREVCHSGLCTQAVRGAGRGSLVQWHGGGSFPALECSLQGSALTL